MRVFFSAGEASGDAYAAALAQEMIRLRGSSIDFQGLAGPKLLATGAQLVVDTSHWGAISITQSIKIVPKVMVALRRVRRELATGEPGLFIPIDFGYLNIRLSRHAKRLGWKVLYFIPPGSWRRDRQGKDLPSLTDAIVTPFSWSADLLNGMGAKAYWFGHPMRQMIGPVLSTERGGIAVLPGSRLHEIGENLPVIAEALRGTEIPATLVVAPNFEKKDLQERWAALSPERTGDSFSTDAVETLKNSIAAVVCSGTATLQAALCHCPMVVMYRLSRMMEFEAKIVRPKFDFIALPNIFLQRRAVPELIQHDASPLAIRTELEAILQGPAREAQLSDFDELDALLGPSDCITKAAELALSMVS